MAYVRTLTLITALQERLAALQRAGSTELLFERVELFGANQLVAAMRATLASEARICFLVPGGDAYTTTAPDSVAAHSQRSTRVALLIADRAMATPEALTGGAHNVGILTLKDDVIEALTAAPLALPGVAFVPAEGEPLVISDEQKPAGNLGRECWLQWLSTYAGETTIVIP